VLYTLGQLSQEFPEVSETLMTKLKDCELRLPSKPPTKLTTKVSVPKVTAIPRNTMNASATPNSQNSNMNSGNFVQPKSFGLGL
jgi:hypothetical protein